METNDLRRLTKIIGIIITTLILMIFMLEMIGLIQKKGMNYAVNEITGNIFNWHDNPIPFLITYIIGYIIVWRKILYGSLIIIAACVTSALFNYYNLNWIIMFIIPPFIIGVLYLILWKRTRNLNNI